MAGKSNLSATLFAQKKLFGKANTSIVKSDSEESIGSNITIGAQTIFGEDVPDNPSRTLWALQNAGGSTPNTVEYVQFQVLQISGSTYNSNDWDSDSKVQKPQDAGPHCYKLALPSNYTTLSSNPNEGNGVFDNDKVLYETIGAAQIVPPNFSGQSPNPYILKIYRDDGSGGVGSEIPLLDEIDWSIDYYNGVLFLQDYDSTKIPAHARGFLYVGKMLNESLSSLSGGGGGGGSVNQAFKTLSVTGQTSVVADSATDTLTFSAGSGISITTDAGSDTVLFKTNRVKTYFEASTSYAPGDNFSCSPLDFSTVNYDPSRIDVLLNGQHLRSGSSYDYQLVSDNEIDFNTSITKGDSILIIVF
tara:strand:+ start:493 stop:1572 length:1080 start_codon:yes stop_codon:yes gene_type:complete